MIRNGVRLKKSEAFRIFYEQSKLDLYVKGALPNPDLIEIRLYGELAKIPSLKNAKIPGMNFINPDVTAKLEALTTHWHKECPSIINYRTEPIFLIAYLAPRSARFDEDNGIASIKDWLEPKHKKKGRTWGIGLIEDDTYVNAYGITWQRLGIQCDFTKIIIRPFAQVKDTLKTFLAESQVCHLGNQ